MNNIKCLALAVWIVLCGSTSAVYATLYTWQDNIPSGVAPFGNVDRLAEVVSNNNHQIVSYPHKAKSVNLLVAGTNKPYPQGQYVSGAMLVNSTFDEVSRTMYNYLGYTKLYPTLVSSKLLQQNGVASLMQYNMALKLPFPIPNLAEKIHIQHDIGHNDGKYASLRSVILQAPIRYAVGNFEWFAISPNQTLIVLTHWADLNSPDGIVVRTILKAVPEVKTAIPYGAAAFVLESLRLKLDKAANTTPATSNLSSIIPAVSANTVKIVGATLQPVVGKQSGIVQIIHPARMLAANSVTFAGNRVTKAEPMRFVSSIFSINAAPAALRSLFYNPEHFIKLFKQVKRVDILDKSANAITYKVHISVSIGFISIPFNSTIQVTTLANSDILIQAVDGDVEWELGRIRFYPQGNNKTTVVWTHNSHIGPNAPALLQLGKRLPYPTLLPTVGVMPIIIHKILNSNLLS